MRVLLPEVSKRGIPGSDPTRICLLPGLSLSQRGRTGERLAIHRRKPCGENEFRAVCRERRIWFAAQTRLRVEYFGLRGKLECPPGWIARQSEFRQSKVRRQRYATRGRMKKMTCQIL